MSELPKENQERDQDVDLSRRKLAKIGAAAPVIMTLASKPVFGAQCLSQMMSGNMSQPGGGSCSLGWGDGDAWKDPASSSQWVIALGGTEDSTYGMLDHGNGQVCSHFTGGEYFSKYFLGADNTPMREVLCDNSLKVGMVSGSGMSAQRQNWIAAFLNSKHSTDYILTPEQVLCFWDGTQGLPYGFPNLDAFFESTW